MGWSGAARLNAKRDHNEREIIQTLEARGYAVWQISGTGVPDLLLSKHGKFWLAEVKQAKGKYTPKQIQFHTRWTGPAIPCLRSVEDALKFPEVQGIPAKPVVQVKSA